MRKTLGALTIIVAILACSASTAAAARLPTLPQHRLSSRATWVGPLDATTLAYGNSQIGSAAEVLPDGTGTPRVVAPPAGCGAVAAGAEHLLFRCDTGGSNPRHSIVTAPDGTVQASLSYSLPDAPVDSTPAGHADTIGAQWLAHAASCYHCLTWHEYVNWHTGEVYNGGAAPVVHVDPDAPGLVAPLCAPLGAVLGADQVSGAWVLSRVSPPDLPDDSTGLLRHCGSTKIYNMGAGLHPLALRGGWLVLWRATRDAGGDPAAQLVLERLRDRKLWALHGARGLYDLSGMGFAATSRRLLIQDITYVDSVMLPQK